jgi:integrase
MAVTVVRGTNDKPGVHIKAVANLLGHSSIAITGDIYGHASDAATRSAVDGLSEVLGL